MCLVFVCVCVCCVCVCVVVVVVFCMVVVCDERGEEVCVSERRAFVTTTYEWKSDLQLQI